MTDSTKMIQSFETQLQDTGLMPEDPLQARAVSEWVARLWNTRLFECHGHCVEWILSRHSFSTGISVFHSFEIHQRR